jgi:hypothetical protein
MQSDPIGYGSGMNIYGFVGGDPVNWTDPLGLVVEHNPYVQFVCPPGDMCATAPKYSGNGGTPLGAGAFLGAARSDRSGGEGGGGGGGGGAADTPATQDDQDKACRGAVTLRSITPVQTYAHYAEGSGAPVALTPEQFIDIANSARQSGLAKNNGNGTYSVPVQLYSSGTRLGYSIGSATIITNRNGAPIGFRDYTNYDSKIRGARSDAAELATRAGNKIAPNGKGFNIVYPCR